MITSGRLRRSAPHERRERIIAVASDVFARDGYGETSMAAIASELGGSKATLYKYFPSKEKLFEAVMQKNCQRLLAPLRESSLDDQADLETVLAEFGKQYLTRLYEPDAVGVNRLIHSEGLKFPELADIFFRSGPDLALSELLLTFERFHENGDLDGADLYLAAGQFVGMLRGDRYFRFAVGTMGACTPGEIEHHARQAAQVFCRGLMRR